MDQVVFESESSEESNGWQKRSEFWLFLANEEKPRRRRERETKPLILTGHGLSIRVEKGSLSIRDGNTHHPAEKRTFRYFKGTLDIPPSIIVVDASGEITLDAMEWLTVQNVPLIRLRWNGQFSSIITAGGQAADSKLVQWQMDTRSDPIAQATFAKETILKKAVATVDTLEHHVPRSKDWDTAMYGIERRVGVLSKLDPLNIRDVLGFEGGIAADYFRAWRALSISWKATKRHPIPNDWRTYNSRSAVRERQHFNSRATHPVNAMLNYAYAILVAQTQIQLVVEGYDPMLGIMHINKAKEGPDYPGFALDRMEPVRPVVDRAILKLVQSEAFAGSDFIIHDDGTCRLNPELARRCVQLTDLAVSDTQWPA